MKTEIQSQKRERAGAHSGVGIAQKLTSLLNSGQWVIAALAMAFTAIGVHAQNKPLQWDLSSRTITYDWHVTDETSAYEIDSNGAIRLLANPQVSEVLHRQLQMDFVSGASGPATVNIHDGSSVDTIMLAADNQFAGTKGVLGTPFGHSFLPPNGVGTSGQTWTEELAAPPHAIGEESVEAQYRYTFVGPSSTLPNCDEIEIVGVRKFVPTPEIMKMDPITRMFYLDFRPFAVGKVLFDRTTGTLQEFNLAANFSMLDFITIPGMLRQVTFSKL
jgi:hypothetical protein